MAEPAPASPADSVPVDMRSETVFATLAEISAAVLDHAGSELTLQLLAERALNLLNADTVGISLINADRRTRSFAAVSGKHAEMLVGRRSPVYRGLCGRVIRAGQPLIANAAAMVEGGHGLAEHAFKARNAVAAPMRWAGKVWGVLAAYDKCEDAAFTSADLQTAIVVANYASTAMENRYLRERNEKSAEELEALYKVSLISGETLNADRSLRTFLDLARPALGFDEACFYLYEDGKLSRTIAAGGADAGDSEHLAPLSRSIADSCVTTNQTIVIGDTRRDHRGRVIAASRESKSIAAVPLRVGARTLGALLLICHAPHGFPRGKLRIARIVSKYAAEAIDRPRLLAAAGSASAALELDKIKTEHLARVSHEIRTPTACIRAAVETLLREDITFGPGEKRRFLETIDSMGDRLTRLAEKLLLVSRSQVGQVPLASSPLELRPRVEQVVQVYRLRGSPHSFIVDIPHQTPVVWADPDRLFAVLDNLISNAVKYSPDGGAITITARVREEDQGDCSRQGQSIDPTAVALRRFLEISIKDSGIGIAAPAIGRLFGPFFQAGTTVGERRGGVGLGLYICKDHVETMGGRIWAQSESGRGSTFTFTLPIHHQLAETS